MCLIRLVLMVVMVVAAFVSAVVADWALEMAWFGPAPALPCLDSTAEADTREVPETPTALEFYRLHRD
jgi:hypothetical protein